MRTSIGMLLAGTMVATAAMAQAPVRLGAPPGGTVSYRVSANTTTGLGAMMARGGGGMSGMMGAMMGGGMSGGGRTRTLDLELGSNRPPSGAPMAEHAIPPGLGLGMALPLITPRSIPVAGSDTMERPRGQLVLYWGCGEKARPGQPVVLDFAKLADAAQSGQTAAILRMSRSMAGMARGMAGASGGVAGPTRGRYTTMGIWPNERTRATIPANASLVGDHLVRGTYTPDIRFTLAPGQDFLDGFSITRNARVGSGAVGLGWQPITRALAYSGMAFGAGRQDRIVIWTTSEIQSESSAGEFAGADEIARLVQARVLLSPQTTQCAVPAEAVRDMGEGGMLTLTGYGPTFGFSAPTRPAKALASWAPDWTTRVATRSTHMTMLGEEMNMDDDRAETPDRRGGEQPARRRRGVLGGMGLPF